MTFLGNLILIDAKKLFQMWLVSELLPIVLNSSKPPGDPHQNCTQFGDGRNSPTRLLQALTYPKGSDGWLTLIADKSSEHYWGYIFKLALYGL